MRPKKYASKENITSSVTIPATTFVVYDSAASEERADTIGLPTDSNKFVNEEPFELTGSFTFSTTPLLLSSIV
jgi:hypothetical protein